MFSVNSSGSTSGPALALNAHTHTHTSSIHADLLFSAFNGQNLCNFVSYTHLTVSKNVVHFWIKHINWREPVRGIGALRPFRDLTSLFAMVGILYEPAPDIQ